MDVLHGQSQVLRVAVEVCNVGIPYHTAGSSPRFFTYGKGHANVPRKAVQDVPKPLDPCTHVGDADGIPVSWL